MSDPLTGICGVDYGVRRVAVVHPATPELVMVELPMGDDLVNQCLLHDWMYSHCASARPDLVLIESPIVGASANIRTGLRLAMVAGALAVAAGSAGARVMLVEPATWKKQVIGHGNANKQQVAEWLQREQPLLARLADGDQDLIDAACIALCGPALLDRERAVPGDGHRPVLRRRRRSAAVIKDDGQGEAGVLPVPGPGGLPGDGAGAQGPARRVGRHNAPRKAKGADEAPGQRAGRGERRRGSTAPEGDR